MVRQGKMIKRIDQLADVCRRQATRALKRGHLEQCRRHLRDARYIEKHVLVRNPDRAARRKMGKLSQRKGRRAERTDITAWENDGYIVADKRSQEAANIHVGVDYVVAGRRGINMVHGPYLAVQRRKGKKPNMRKAYADARAGATGDQVPVAHVTFDQNRPGEFGDDVAVIDWLEFRRLVKAAHPASSWD